MWGTVNSKCDITSVKTWTWHPRTIIKLASVQVREGSLTSAFTLTPFNTLNLSSVHHNISRWAFRESEIFTQRADKEWHRFTSQLWVELRGRKKETLDEEEATDSGVTLSVASSPDDITTPHTLYCFQSTHFLSVRGRNLHFSKGRFTGGRRQRQQNHKKRSFMQSLQSTACADLEHTTY